MPRTKDPIQEQIDELTARLLELREEAMERAGYSEFGHKQLASFHGKIGGKNNVYVDSVRQVFLSPGQFIAEWQQGLLERAERSDRGDIAYNGHRRQSSAAHRIIEMLQDDVLNEYITLFLERNFYNEYLARTRQKPADALWEIWFGQKNQEYGLFISPRFRNEEWENDVSEIRRVSFDYWTIGHVLSTGLLVPDKAKPRRKRTLDDLFEFYQDVVIRSTNSVHGTAFAEKYEEYVRYQDEPEKVPFLIPEFRYEGTPTGPHKHRLDFTILSSSRRIRVGIELSPWSTHGKVKGVRKLEKEGGKAAIEKEQIRKWEADTTKRNAYFKKFGITTITFTDSDLADMDEAFSQIEEYLCLPDEEPAPSPKVSKAIQRYTFDRS